MNSSKIYLSLACVALVLSLTLAVDKVTGIWLDSVSPTSDGVLLLITLGCASGTIVFWTRRSISNQKAVKHALATVGRMVHELDEQRNALDLRASDLEARAEHVHAVLHDLTEPVLAVDQNDRVLFANPSAMALFSQDSATTEDRALATLVSCEQLVELLGASEGRNGTDRRHREIAIADQAGATHWYRVTMRNLVPPAAEEGAIEGTAPSVVAVLHDISSQKAMQTRNAQFVSAVSHEMLTPLAGIKAYVELLLDGEAQDEVSQTHFLEVINQQTNRLQRLVDEMLNLSRLEAGVTGVNKENCSLNVLLTKAVQAVERTAQARGVRLLSQFSADDLDVLVDRGLTLDGASHLLANAIHSVPPGGQVIVRTLAEGNSAVFEVEDSGPRLSATERGRVFEKFFRLRPESGAAEGTGLGLPLVKHIVEQVHGGSIEVESAPETGNVFRVFLPLAKTADRELAAAAAPVIARQMEVCHE